MKFSLYAVIGRGVTTRNDLAVLLELAAMELRSSEELFTQLKPEDGLTVDSGLLLDITGETVGNWIIRQSPNGKGKDLEDEHTTWHDENGTDYCPFLIECDDVQIALDTWLKWMLELW